MIDPYNIVRYDYTDAQLEELAIFCICVAGKTARVIAPRVHKLINKGQNHSPFEVVRSYSQPHLAFNMKTVGIGCHNQKAESVKELAHSGLDLRKCSVSDLEAIKGIGPKTSRFFIMSSRKGVQHAALDVHLTSWLRDIGVSKVPKQTPSGKKYIELEKIYLKAVPDGYSPAEWDLIVWKYYSNKIGNFPVPNAAFDVPN